MFYRRWDDVINLMQSLTSKSMKSAQIGTAELACRVAHRSVLFCFDDHEIHMPQRIDREDSNSRENHRQICVHWWQDVWNRDVEVSLTIDSSDEKYRSMPTIPQNSYSGTRRIHSVWNFFSSLRSNVSVFMFSMNAPVMMQMGPDSEICRPLSCPMPTAHDTSQIISEL